MIVAEPFPWPRSCYCKNYRDSIHFFLSSAAVCVSHYGRNYTRWGGVITGSVFHNGARGILTFFFFLRFFLSLRFFFSSCCVAAGRSQDLYVSPLAGHEDCLGTELKKRLSCSSFGKRRAMGSAELKRGGWRMITPNAFKSGGNFIRKLPFSRCIAADEVTSSLIIQK